MISSEMKLKDPLYKDIFLPVLDKKSLTFLNKKRRV
jgi:hypothetical protein